MARKKWYYWNTLPRQDLSELKKYPEFLGLQRRGDWSKIKFHSGKRIVHYKTNEIDFNEMFPVFSEMIEKGFTIRIVPLNLTFIRIIFTLPEEKFYCKTCDELHPDWELVKEVDGVRTLICKWCEDIKVHNQ